MVKFKLKDGYPSMSIIYEHKKYRTGDLELPEDVFKYAIEKGIYGIEKIAKEKKDGNSRSE